MDGSIGWEMVVEAEVKDARGVLLEEADEWKFMARRNVWVYWVTYAWMGVCIES